MAIDESPPILSVKKLSKFYALAGQAGHQALHEVTFEVLPGEIYGLIGMSGAGKSTLMRCLIGLEKPSSGTLHFRDQSIAAMSPAELITYRRRIGMVFQHFNLLPSRTALENICFPMEVAGLSGEAQKKRAKELLEVVGLSHKENYYPAKLSGGEKQRIGIARALANQPEILFCDEATSALDPSTIKGILNLIQNLNETLKLTVVVITHQFDVVKQICSKVGVLSHGELVEEGSVENLFCRPQHVATQQLIGTQLPPLPEEVMEKAGERGLYRLHFKGPEVKQPIITRLLRQFAVEVNILQANLDSFQHAVFGLLVVELSGLPQECEKALEFLRQHNVTCEEIT